LALDSFFFGRCVEVGVECGQKGFELRKHEGRDFGAHRQRGAQRCLWKPFVLPRQVLHHTLAFIPNSSVAGSRAVLGSSSCAGIARAPLESVMFAVPNELVGWHAG
jgi:hypothetical protein